jgi:hypothetical protein
MAKIAFRGNPPLEEVGDFFFPFRGAAPSIFGMSRRLCAVGISHRAFYQPNLVAPRAFSATADYLFRKREFSDPPIAIAPLEADL